ncbi:hypothetical protein JZK55_13050 [Dissulfurispira thermophila]|uniref:Uncharacterized protein n=1 Tax=Dissulfurispira thermophila TaxID=2715679 RepID=A0A7G1H2M0_9BACT|nr:hypothetical protein JZK55_13050 [Dissulfurispira thermophila]
MAQPISNEQKVMSNEAKKIHMPKTKGEWICECETDTNFELWALIFELFIVRITYYLLLY